jgi:hypothetical protein
VPALLQPAGRLQAAATLQQQSAAAASPAISFPFPVDQFTSRWQRQDQQSSVHDLHAPKLRPNHAQFARRACPYTTPPTLPPCRLPAAPACPPRPCSRYGQATSRGAQHAPSTQGRRPARPWQKQDATRSRCYHASINHAKASLCGACASLPPTLVLPLPRHGLGIRAAWK